MPVKVAPGDQVSMVTVCGVVALFAATTYSTR
jgi:hypothetical protein